MWTQWLNGLLGVWIMIAAWSFLPPGRSRIILVVTGVIIALLGFLGGGKEAANRT